MAGQPPGDTVQPGPLPAALIYLPLLRGTCLGDGLLEGSSMPDMNHSLITSFSLPGLKSTEPWFHQARSLSDFGAAAVSWRDTCILPLSLGSPQAPPWPGCQNPCTIGFPDGGEAAGTGWQGQVCRLLWQCLAHGTRCWMGDGLPSAM